jgi:hypothetical protein
MKYVYTFICLITCLVSKAQQRQETYKFVVENKVMIEGMPGFYLGANREHSQTRIIYKDTLPSESLK